MSIVVILIMLFLRRRRRRRYRAASRLTFLNLVAQLLRGHLQRPRRGLKRFFRRVAVSHAPRRVGRRRTRWTPNSVGLEGFDVFEMSGLFEDEFEQLFQRIKGKLTLSRLRPKKNSRVRFKSVTKLTARARLLMGLHFLKRYNFLADIAMIFRVHKSTVSRELHHCIPIIRGGLNHIQWPLDWSQVPVGFENAQVIMDGTAHYRNRVHPGQRELYRGDKHAHFILALVVTDMTGVPVRVVLANGHNNDSGLFNVAEIGAELRRHNLFGLADRGFGNPRLITPCALNSSEWRANHARARLPVEIVNSVTKIFNVAAARFRGSIEFQLVCLESVYELVAQRLQHHPIVDANNLVL